MLDLLAKFVRHNAEIVSVAMALYAFAAVVVNTTPTPKDDEALDGLARIGVKAYRLIEIIAGIWTRRAKS